MLYAPRDRAQSEPTVADEKLDDPSDPVSRLQIGEDKRACAAHAPCVATMISRLAPTSGARSVLLMTRRSERVMPGPPLRGILSPAATSMT